MEKPGGKPSKLEALKLASEYLRASLPQELQDGKSSISEEASSLLKFHGSYQQDDRDLRTQRKREGLDKAFQFMVRLRLPGGKLTAAQYLVCDELARGYGNGTLRITSRQSFQFHGVLKENLKATIATINRAWLSTLAACGDVERNVLACPAPLCDGIRDAMQADADAFAAHFAPRSNTYWEIWLDGEKIDNPLLPQAGPALVPTAGDDLVEPLYGKAYMARKFKTAFALPDDNCTDVYANDLGLLGVVEHGVLVGYNVLVGGGMGTTPSAAKTFPAVAKPLAYVPRAKLLRVGEAILKVTRDFANRSDRKRARLKYVIHDWGVDSFKAKVEDYLQAPLDQPRNPMVTEVCDHMGWHAQGDGKLWLGIPVENGRIRDDGSYRLASGLRAFFRAYGTPARLSCMQSILLADVEWSWKPAIEAWLAEYGIATVEQISAVRRWSMACPAFPTCGLSVTESERVMPQFIGALEAELERLGLSDERFTVHMTGCPNGCARPYNSDIGLVGRSALKTDAGANVAGTYSIFLGGSTLGERLNVLYKDYVPFDQIVHELRPVLESFCAERLNGERLGDFCHRVGLAKGVSATAYAKGEAEAECGE
jgi:sulfite reductase (ferredoxin)